MRERDTPRIAMAAAVLAGIALLTSVAGVGVLVGIPALVCGHVAARRIRRSGGALGGGELATGALVMGYLSLALGALTLGVLILPAIGKWRNAPPRPEVRRVLWELRGRDGEAVRAAVLGLLSDGKQDVAERVLDKAMRRHPRDQRLLFARAVLHRSRWSRYSANALMGRAAAADPATVEGRCARLSTALDRGEEVEANMEALRALADAMATTRSCCGCSRSSAARTTDGRAARGTARSGRPRTAGFWSISRSARFSFTRPSRTSWAKSGATRRRSPTGGWRSARSRPDGPTRRWATRSRC